MKLSYDLMLSPFPIKLSIGTLIKPTIGQIFKLGLSEYEAYQMLMKLSPENYYMTIYDGDGQSLWESFTDEQKVKVKLFNIIKTDESLVNDYKQLLNFFFEEKVLYYNGLFVLIDNSFKSDDLEELPTEAFIGAIGDNSTFCQVLSIIQQICCIYDDSEDVGDIKFKNSKAEQLYIRMKAAENKRKEKEKEENFDYSIPNIVSAVSNCHPTINPINVWELTMFQLIDSFERLQTMKIYDLRSLSVSVWGDKENTFNISEWHKNIYEK